MAPRTQLHPRASNTVPEASTTAPLANASWFRGRLCWSANFDGMQLNDGEVVHPEMTTDHSSSVSMAPDDQCTARDDHQQLECIRHWIVLWAQCTVLGKMTKANVDSRKSHIALHCIPLHHTLHLTKFTKLDYIALHCIVVNPRG